MTLSNSAQKALTKIHEGMLEYSPVDVSVIMDDQTLIEASIFALFDLMYRGGDTPSHIRNAFSAAIWARHNERGAES